MIYGVRLLHAADQNYVIIQNGLWRYGSIIFANVEKQGKGLKIMTDVPFWAVPPS